MTHRLTTCTFCGVGCGLYLEDIRQPGGGRLSQPCSHPTNTRKNNARAGGMFTEVASRRPF